MEHNLLGLEQRQMSWKLPTCPGPNTALSLLLSSKGTRFDWSPREQLLQIL